MLKRPVVEFLALRRFNSLLSLVRHFRFYPTACEIQGRNLFEHCVDKDNFEGMVFCHEALGVFSTSSNLLLRAVQHENAAMLQYLHERGLQYKADSLVTAAVKTRSLPCLEYIRNAMGVQTLASPAVLEIALFMATEHLELTVLDFVSSEFELAFSPKQLGPFRHKKFSLFKTFSRAVKRDFVELLEYAYFVLKIDFVSREYDPEWEHYSKLLGYAVERENFKMLQFLVRTLGLSVALYGELNEDSLLKLIFAKVSDPRLLKKMIKFVLPHESRENLKNLKTQLSLAEYSLLQGLRHR